MGKKRARHQDDDANGQDAAMRKRRYGGGDADVELNYDGEGKGEGEEEQAPQTTAGPLDDESGQRSAFPGLDSLDYDGVSPGDALQYLSMVRREAATQPVFVATRHNFDRAPAASQTQTQTAVVVVDGSRSSFQIDVAQHREFMHQFAHRRESSMDASAEDWTMPDTRKQWRKLMIDTEPDAARVAAISEPVVVTLLGYMHNWVSPSLPVNLDKWLVALLVRLPDTLVGNDIAVIRHLARKCVHVRSTKQVKDDRVAQALDQVIGIVAGFYRQYDIMPCIKP